MENETKKSLRPDDLVADNGRMTNTDITKKMARNIRRYSDEKLDKELSFATGNAYDELSQAWYDLLVAERQRRSSFFGEDGAGD